MVSKKGKKKLNTIDKIVLVINILFSVATLCSYLAPDTDPRDSSVIAILGFGYLVLLIINSILIIYWLIRRSLYTLISTLTILIGFTTFIAYCSFHLPNESKGNKVAVGGIRVMAYNVHEFKGIEELDGQPAQNEMLQVVYNGNPDIVTFEEFVAKKADHNAVIDSLRKNLKYNYHYFKRFQINSKVSDSSGNAIFTKFPIIDTGSVASAGTINIITIFADVRINGRPIRIYCVHLSAVQIMEDDKRKYLSGRLILEKSSFIESRLSSAFILRAYQVEKIKEHMSKCPYPYIVAGDFNDTPNSFAVNEIGDGLKNAFEEKGSGFQTTYYSAFPLHIDYLFASPQFDVLSYQAIDKKLSDHKPIISDLRLR